jgi:hypothetical protein
MELTKTVLVSLTLREGEREFCLKPVSMSVGATLNDDEITILAVSDQCGVDYELNDRGEFYYAGGEYCVYLTEVKDIPQKEFEILSKYL